MGALIPGCECCLGATPTDVIDKKGEDTSSTSDSDSDTSSSDEERPLRKKKRKRSKRYYKKKRHKKRENSDNAQRRDESYFSSSDNDEEDKYRKRKRDKRKRNKKKKKEEEEEEERRVSDMQKELREKSKSEIDKNDNDSIDMVGFYGMDTKTMELLLNVGDIGQNSAAPQPPMPSIPSIPLNPSIDYNDISPMEKKEVPTPDMKTQFSSYTSEMMYSGGDKEIEESYDDLTVIDDGDITPALPGGDDTLNDVQKRTLGGLDYDFGSPEEVANDDVAISDALRADEKNLSYSRIHRTLQQTAENAQDADHIQQVIAAQYTHEDEKEDEQTDDSSYEEHEMEEIRKRKTEDLMFKTKTTGKVSKAKLFRPETETPWDTGDMHAMELAMNKHMESMRIHSDDMATEEDTDSESDDDVEAMVAIRALSAGDKKDKKKSQLFRFQSAYKWDVDRLDEENTDMQAQLASLMLQHQTSNEDVVNTPNLQQKNGAFSL